MISFINIHDYVFLIVNLFTLIQMASYKQCFFINHIAKIHTYL